MVRWDKAVKPFTQFSAHNIIFIINRLTLSYSTICPHAPSLPQKSFPDSLFHNFSLFSNTVAMSIVLFENESCINVAHASNYGYLCGSSASFTGLRAPWRHNLCLTPVCITFPSTVSGTHSAPNARWWCYNDTVVVMVVVMMVVVITVREEHTLGW